MIAIKYSLFAVVAILLNLLAQYISFSNFYNIYIAMGVGTIVGLVAKYILDKKYIFDYVSKNTIDNARKFVLYTITGITTTVIFWLTELSFDIIFINNSAKYIGAIIGLSIGYFIKYFLDKKYVFNKSLHNSVT